MEKIAFKNLFNVVVEEAIAEADVYLASENIVEEYVKLHNSIGSSVSEKTEEAATKYFTSAKSQILKARENANKISDILWDQLSAWGEPEEDDLREFSAFLTVKTAYSSNRFSL